MLSMDRLPAIGGATHSGARDSPKKDRRRLINRRGGRVRLPRYLRKEMPWPSPSSEDPLATAWPPR